MNKSTYDNYLNEEVRSGFMIPSQIKQAWAAQLKVLASIDEICRRHDIKYFADWGTLIGTVRHGGYIPWDDDLDICMKREDLEKFMQYADDELPKEYMIQNYRRQKDHWLYITKVVNNSHICYEPQHLREYDGFPYLACVDIFILDYMYRDEEKENERKKVILRTLAIADGIVEGRYSISEMDKEIKTIERRVGHSIERKSNPNAMGVELYAAAEEMFMEVKEEDADSITQIFPFGLKENNHLIFPKEYYSDMIYLPFENQTIPVPLAFDVVLKKKYGPYLTVNKGGGAHGYPYFEGQKAEFFKNLDFELPSYKYTREIVNGKLKSNEKPYIQQSYYLLDEMRRLCDEYNKSFEEGSDSVAILTAIQDYAVALGGLFEGVKGEGASSISNIITLLENVCELVYELGLQVNEGSYNSINTDFIEKITNEITIFKQRRDVLFLSRSVSEWKYMKNYYDLHCEDKDCDVVVVPLARFKKDYDGTLIGRKSDASEYPDSIRLMDEESYEVSAVCPDIVYTDDAFDEWHPVFSISPRYYSKEIVKYAERLIYISPYEIDGFSQTDEREWYNSQHYIAMPGLVNSDEIIVYSEKVKETYAKVLSDFTKGQISEEDYLRRICINSYNISEGATDETAVATDESGDNHRTKKLLVALSIGNLIENKEKQIEKVKRIEQVLEQNGDKLEIGWMIFPESLPESVEERYEDILQPYRELVGKYKQNGSVVDASGTDKQELVEMYDAYYGDPTYLVHEFVRAHKPVMISNVEV